MKVAVYAGTRNIYKDMIKKTKKYVQRHFSKEIQNELLKLLDKSGL